MARRSQAADAVPVALLVYRERDWSSPEAWRSARAAWRETRPPKTLAELNATFYGPTVVFPPCTDPREVPYGA